ncbi:MAG: hypothetical protein MSC56_05395 [Clostridiales bacterium]|nr:hypothetical protein [Clostridiales bacterium]
MTWKDNKPVTANKSIRFGRFDGADCKLCTRGTYNFSHAGRKNAETVLKAAENEQFGTEY